MCRPLWACWVNGQSYTVRGEGSHQMIAASLKGKTVPAGHRLQGWPLCPASVAWMHPFECRWPSERIAKFQPQGDRFYEYVNLPTKHQFDMAQEALDRDIGNWEKLRDWILAAAELYGKTELLPQTVTEVSIFSRGLTYTEPLYIAVNRVLRKPICVVGEEVGLDPDKLATAFQSRNALGDDSIFYRTRIPRIVGNETFVRWADAFSDRKNRVPLWQS